MSSQRTDAPPAEAPTAAILLVGNELLSGKIRDSNGHFMARMLRRRGICLLEICVVPDDVESIAEAVRRLVLRASVLFTSGGVGPTHDDMTLAGISRATGRPLVRNTDLERRLRRHFGETITPQALAMADLPDGTVLCAQPGWPALRLDVEEPKAARIYMLPGVPDLLHAKIEMLEQAEGELPRGEAWHVARLDTSLRESTLASKLEAVASDFPEVEIGSYPRWVPDDSGRLTTRVQVTFEARGEHATQVERARDALRAILPADAVLDPCSAP
jgi:molybdenum cofactor synthesis domain-containing protein